ncbi:hypothetical protein ABZS66_02635 [Dactylosporangium sp. NPDC005572]|uniref:hypothetical protein n=1 Tax=Dactylosporangium sp. NPDC005572 TaxID=3156889 RepID=UPI0033BAD7BB
MIDFDPVAPYPELRQLRAEVDRRNWPAVAAFFARLTDPDDHEYAVRIVSDTNGSDAFLRAAAEHEPGTLARVLHAARLITVGWRMRTGARAQHVSQEQFANFHDYLRRAERILIGVTAEEPGNTSAWVQRLKINRGLELGQAEVRRRYDRLARHVPHVFVAQASVVQQYCPKWGGTDEKAHAFGLECMRRGPDGSLAALSMVEAHVEIGMDWDDERNTVAYLRRPAVRAEIDEAAARSVRHPAFRARGYRAITAHNYFALVYGKMGDLAAARPHFQAIGGFGAGFLWGYFGDEHEVFASLRTQVLGR